MLASALASNQATVQNYLATGDCESAKQAASLFTDASPDDPLAWRALGDAARCSGDSRAALKAYRQSAALKDDPGLTALMDSLSSAFSSVVLTVNGADEGIAPVLSVAVDEESIEPIEGTLWDLPSETELILSVGGPGYATADVPFTTAKAGEVSALTVDVTFLGRGTVNVDTMADGVTAILGDTVLETGETSVLAGTYDLTVRGPTGSLTTAVEVSPDGVTAIAPMLLLPAVVNLLGLPEGTTLTFTDGPGELAPVEVVRGEGTLDPKVGIRVVDAVKLEGLPQGEWHYQLQHPIFGTLNGRFFAVGGQVSAEPVPWRTLPTVAPLEQQYAAYLAAPRAGLGQQGRRAAIATGVGVGLAAATTVVASGIPTQSALVQEHRAQYDQAVANGDVDAGNAAYLDLNQAQNNLKARRITAASTGGVTAISAGAATLLWKRWAGNRETTEWNPWP